MGVSRWTEWRTRLDAARAGLVRDWTLPDPEARGYGRGAVRVLELAFVRTREVTKRVAANREEKASRAERRREARRQAKNARRAATPPAAPVHSPTLPNARVTREDLTSPAAGRLWEMLRRVQSAPASDGPALAHAHPPRDSRGPERVAEVELGPLRGPRWCWSMGRASAADATRARPRMAGRCGPSSGPAWRPPSSSPPLQQSHPCCADGCAGEPSARGIAEGVDDLSAPEAPMEPDRDGAGLSGPWRPTPWPHQRLKRAARRGSGRPPRRSPYDHDRRSSSPTPRTVSGPVTEDCGLHLTSPRRLAGSSPPRSIGPPAAVYRPLQGRRRRQRILVR